MERSEFIKKLLFLDFAGSTRFRGEGVDCGYHIRMKSLFAYNVISRKNKHIFKSETQQTKNN